MHDIMSFKLQKSLDILNKKCLEVNVPIKAFETNSMKMKPYQNKEEEVLPVENVSL